MFHFQSVNHILANDVSSGSAPDSGISTLFWIQSYHIYHNLNLIPI